MSDSILLVQSDLTQAVVISEPSNIVVEATATETIISSAGQQGPQGIQGLQGIQGPSAAISTASDVDISTLETGSLLIYEPSIGKWVASTIISTGTGTGTGTLPTILDGSPNKVPGSFGGTSAVPVITVDTKGRITAITTATISSSLSIAGTTGTDTVSVGADTLTFAGGTGVTTAVTNNQVSFAIGQAVAPTSNVTFNNLTVSGNLTVTGTTTSINTTTLEVSDVNITVAKNATTAAAANGAGLTVAGAGATFTYTSADDRWNLNKNLNVATVSGALSGNATTATALATPRTISITGDLAYTTPSFDGSGNVTALGTLATVNSNVGSFGSGTSVPNFTVNAKGLITAAGSTAIATATNSVLGLASFNSTEFLVTTGAVTIATVDGGTY